MVLGRVVVAVPVLWVFTPSLTKVIPLDGWACVLLALTRSRSTHFAISTWTLSCLHLYRPSANALGQPVRMWFRVPEEAQLSLAGLPQVLPR